MLSFQVLGLLARDELQHRRRRIDERVGHEVGICTPHVRVTAEQVLHRGAVPCAFPQGGNAATVQLGRKLLVRDVAEGAEVIDDTGKDAGPLVGQLAQALNTRLAGCR